MSIKKITQQIAWIILLFCQSFTTVSSYRSLLIVRFIEPSDSSHQKSIFVGVNM